MILGTIKIILAATCGVVIAKKNIQPFVEYLAEIVDELFNS